jgi:hypothetical protein
VWSESSTTGCGSEASKSGASGVTGLD